MIVYIEDKNNNRVGYIITTGKNEYDKFAKRIFSKYEKTSQ